jgi:hypothetical protein
MRLMIVIQYLRQNTKWPQMKQMYNISKAYISRELRHILPLAYCALSTISLPLVWHEHPFEQVSGAVDCSSHFRTRIHPRQSEWYRYDKHGFFFTAQCVVDLTGVFLHVHLGLGHNNDKGMFILTKMKEFMRMMGVRWLGDSGYSYELLITPDPNKSKAWNDMQKGMRSIVEVSIGMVKLYAFTAERVQVAPEIHELGILTCYKLTNLRLKAFPLRPARPTSLLLTED